MASLQAQKPRHRVLRQKQWARCQVHGVQVNWQSRLERILTRELYPMELLFAKNAQNARYLTELFTVRNISLILFLSNIKKHLFKKPLTKYRSVQPLRKHLRSHAQQWLQQHLPKSQRYQRWQLCSQRSN